MADSTFERIYRLVVDGGPALAQLNKISGSVSNIDERFSKLGSSLKTAFGFLAAGGIAKSIADNANQLNSLSASLSTLRGSAESGAEMVERVFNIVDRTGVSLKTAGDAITRLSIGLQSLGANNDQINQIAENFIKLGRVGGSTVEEVNGALLQFGQALSSGVLQGDEFKSISEQMPLLMQRLAASLNVTVGQLKKMGSEGKLTSDVIANALLENTEELDAAFAKLPETWEQGMNRIQASLARLSQQWFNQTEAGNTMVKVLNIISEEIDNITAQSSEWKPIVDDIAASFKQLGIFVIDSVREIKLFAAYVTQIGAAVKAVINRDFDGFEKVAAQFDEARVSIENTAARQKRYLQGTSNELDQLGVSVDNFTNKTGKLAPPPAIVDAGKAAKEAAKEIKALESTWDSLFKKVQTPEESFAASSKQLDEIIAKLNPAAEAVARVRAELEKTRAKAAEAVRVEGLTEFQKGFEAAAKSLTDFGNEAEQLKGKLDLLNQLRGVEALNDVYLKLADSLGESATAADQVAVAVAKVNAEASNTAALQAEFEKLRASGKLSAEQLAKVKEALGGLGESKTQLDAISTAIGQTLAGSVSSFVDVLLSSESSINDWFANLLIQLGKLIVQMTIINQLKAQAGTGGFWGWLGGLVTGSASGNQFNGGTGLPQGVYTQPTMFKFAKGAAFGGRLGQLAEAGPEAIVPLKRTGSGDLGVQASPVYVNVNNYSDQSVEVSETNREDGSRQIDILIGQKIKSSFADGSLDRVMRDNYNVSRAGR